MNVDNPYNLNLESTESQTVSEKEYCNYYYSIEIGEDGTPVAVPYVNVYYRLYTLK